MCLNLMNDVSGVESRAIRPRMDYVKRRMSDFKKYKLYVEAEIFGCKSVDLLERIET
jgi:hypothetical protein